MNDLLDRAVLALRDETGSWEDGIITGQRIEAVWLQRRARRRVFHRLAAVAAATLVLGGAALAATNLARRARLAKLGLVPVKTAHPEAPPLPVPPPAAPAASPPMADASVPAVAVRPVSAPASVADPATSAYAAAHRAHFVDRNWSQALALWTRYLRLAPRGPLAPEAHWNRAISLIRLDRLDDAAADLQPFIRGRWGSYRQSEARQLLESIAVPARE
jgi:hypothetical protein